MPSLNAVYVLHRPRFWHWASEIDAATEKYGYYHSVAPKHAFRKKNNLFWSKRPSAEGKPLSLSFGHPAFRF